MKKLLLTLFIILGLVGVAWGGEKEDLQKDLALMQERLGRLSAEFELTKMQAQQIHERLRLILEKEKAEAIVKKENKK